MATLVLALAAAGCQDAGPAPRTAAPPGPAPTRPHPRSIAELAGTDPDGRPFTLAGLRGRPTVVVLYRSASCPICMRRLLALRRHLPEYRALGATVVAITGDPPAVLRQTARTLDLDARLLSASRADLETLGLWPPDAWAPLPATFLLDRDRRVRYRHVGRTAAEHVGDLELVATLRAIEDDARPATAP